jgi:hypothetical protein
LKVSAMFATAQIALSSLAAVALELGSAALVAAAALYAVAAVVVIAVAEPRPTARRADPSPFPG